MENLEGAGVLGSENWFVVVMLFYLWAVGVRYVALVTVMATAMVMKVEIVQICLSNSEIYGVCLVEVVESLLSPQTDCDLIGLHHPQFAALLLL
jgi:hypothetical protein